MVADASEAHGQPGDVARPVACLITAVLAAGQLAGAWAAGTLLARPAPGRLLRPPAVAATAVAAAGTSFVLVSASTEIGVVYVLTALIGCALGGFGVARQTMLARLTDERLHGSVFAAHAALVNVAVGVGLPAAGAAENLLGPRAVYAATGLVLLAAFLASLPWRSLMRTLGTSAGWRRRARPCPSRRRAREAGAV